MDSNGHIHSYKACLVAKGISQKGGVDYTDAFVPVVRFESIRAVISMVAAHVLETVQFGIETAFLHGDLHERNVHALTLWLHSSGFSYLRLPYFEVLIRTRASCSFLESEVS